MTESHNHDFFMRAALAEARTSASEGNQGVGSVIVRDGVIIATGRNLENTEHDPTAHAETVAIRNFVTGLADADGNDTERGPWSDYNLEARVLSDAVLYTTFEPCPMCCGAILSAGVSTVVMGGRPARDATRWGDYTIEKLLEMTGWDDRVIVVTGVLVDECFAARSR